MKQIIKMTSITLTIMFLSTMMLSAQMGNMMHKENKTDNKMDIRKVDANKDGVVEKRKRWYVEQYRRHCQIKSGSQVNNEKEWIGQE